MSKKNLEKIDRSKNVIGMEEFVTYYLNDGMSIPCRKLTHRELKGFQNPYVITVSYEFASRNIELVFTHQILLVSDGRKHIAPYINPLELRKIRELNKIDEAIKELKQERIYQLCLIVQYWNQLQVLLRRKEEIERTIHLLEELHKQDFVLIEGKESYVKKYQGR